jgi:uncharacterized SAM-binding protein YcdF (DUF218 family)
MAFWNRRHANWDEQTNEYYADRMRERTGSDRIRVIPHLFLIGFVGALFVGAVGVVAGQTMLEKTLTALAFPCGILWLALIVLVYFSLLLRQAWPSLIGLFCLVLLTVAGNSFVANWLTAQREAPFEDLAPMNMEPYDVVFLLGGGTTTRLDGTPQLDNSGDRVTTAARLFHAGKIRNIVCSGTQSFRTTEKDLHPHEEAANILVELGVPRENVLEMNGENTSEEMANIRKWLDANPNPGRIGILSSAWHLQRVMRLAERAGVIADPIPADFLTSPFVPSPNLIIPSSSNLETTRKILKEYLADVIGR